ncbi:MAG: ABC transporter permease [Alphaproteobacteria bacterium]|nr:ABC transporter permease [Alphaproteobacteria bacterium]
MRSLTLTRLVGIAPLLIFVAMLAYIGFNAPNFFTVTTADLVLKQSIPVVVVSLGLAIVVMAGGDDIVAGGIDLSIPSTAALAASITALLVTNMNQPLIVGLLAALAAALAIGLVNALLVTRINMTPLLATLASSVAIVGIASVVTSSRRINVTDPAIVFIRDGCILGISADVVLVAILVFVAFHLIHRTRWGMNMQAVGGSRDAAEISGIPVKRFLFSSFVLAALAGWLAAPFVLARGSGVSPGVEENLLIEMVLATFLGAAFSPRRVVTLWGAVLGAILVAAVSIGFKSMGVNVFWTGLIKGSLILIVVALAAVSSRTRT